MLIVPVLLLGLILYFGTAPIASAADTEGWVFQQELRLFTEVSAVDANTAWAVDMNGNILKTTNGVNWGVQYSSTPYLYGVSAVDVKTAYAVGTGGRILKTADGVRWDPQVSPTQADLRGVSAVKWDAKYAWAVGDNGTILRTTNGVNWEEQVSPTQAHLSGVYAVNIYTAWAVGQDGTILRTTNGVRWDPQVSGTQANLTGVSARPELMPKPVGAINSAWAVGQDGTILKNTDGVTWEEQDSGTPEDLIGVSNVSSTAAWAVGPNGTILKTHDGGSTWVEQDSGTTTLYLMGVSAVDATTAWAVGGTWTDPYTILKTTDGGDERPDIASINPSDTWASYPVKVSGSDFGSTRGASYVSFGDVRVTEYTSWSDTEINFRIPFMAKGGHKVTVTTATGVSNEVQFIRNPPIDCGTGGGVAVVMLGLTLGLLSVAGSQRIRKRFLMRLKQVR